MNPLLLEQDRLRHEGAAVLADLDLVARLSALGEPTLVGSAALGVMVHRDLDLTMSCSRLDAGTTAGIAGLGAELALHERVRQVQIRDDTGPWNTDPRYPDGFYLGVRYRTAEGRDWSLDLWFVDAPDRQPDLAHVRELTPLLTDERRAIVLALRRRLGEAAPPSFRICRAVLADGATSPAELQRWLASRADD